MMLLTFLLFFAFVVNVGMIVNAKINLQNAADLAAYAGAATQARQLTQIGMLNYEMRRQYKKFLFRYYVLGNMAQRDFPRDGGPPPITAKYAWKPNSGSPENFKNPAVCLTMRDRPTNGSNTANDNYCAQDRLPPIGTPPVIPGDPISQVLAQNLAALESIRLDNCEGIGELNRQVLTFWLYNSDPNFDSISGSYSGTQFAEVLKIFKGVASGLGLMPKLLLLNQRIQTLAKDYVNAPAVTGINMAALQRMEADLDPAQFERTIQAYRSAFYTLGENSFISGSVTMDEVIPPQLIELVSTKTKFDTFAIEFKKDQVRGCEYFLNPIMVPEIVTGVYKKPELLTYYAVRLKAKARILFSPFRDFQGIDLEAFSAAQPFGSRIGPDENLIPNEFAEVGGSSTMTPCSAVPSPCTGDFPNLAFDVGKSITWKNSFTLYHFFKQLTSSGGAANQINSDELKKALKAATSPNPRESPYYLIANDLDANSSDLPNDSGPTSGTAGDPFIKFFDNPSRVEKIYAPFAKGAGNFQNVIDEVNRAIQQLNFTPPPGNRNFDLFKFKNALSKGITDYLESLKNGKPGDGGEDLYFYQVNDPFFYDPPAPGLPAQVVTLPKELMIRDPKLVRNSWNSPKDSRFVATGRAGYSVKHVSFQALQNPQGLGLCTNPGGGACTSWTNFPTTAPSASPFLPFLSH